MTRHVATAFLIAAAMAVSAGAAFAQARSVIELDEATPRAIIIQQLQAGTVSAGIAQPTDRPTAVQEAMPLQPGTAQEATLLMPVQFGFDSAELTPQARAILDVVAMAMNDPVLAGSRFLLEGHADATGSWQYNAGLSKRRADSVAAYLMTRGVGAERLLTIGYSWNRLLPGLAVNDPRHRRVEIGRLTP